MSWNQSFRLIVCITHTGFEQALERISRNSKHQGLGRAGVHLVSSVCLCHEPKPEPKPETTERPGIHPNEIGCRRREAINRKNSFMNGKGRNRVFRFARSGNSFGTCVFFPRRKTTSMIPWGVYRWRHRIVFDAYYCRRCSMKTTALPPFSVGPARPLSWRGCRRPRFRRSRRALPRT